MSLFSNSFLFSGSSTYQNLVVHQIVCLLWRRRREGREGVRGSGRGVKE